METNKYNNSCIYKISKDNFIYIGSTCNFKQRMSQHKSACNNIKSKSYNLKIYQTIRLHGGWDLFEKVVIKNICCENREELREIEGEFIKNIGTMNCQISGRSQKKYQEDNKDKISERNKKYYKNNKDKISERNKKYNKKYYENNKDKISEKNKINNKKYRENNKDKIKQYRENNKKKLAEKKKQYRENNKDKIKQYLKNNKDKRRRKIICPICGILTVKYNINRHQKSKRCLKLLIMKNEI